jgi:hypothetical protein
VARSTARRLISRLLLVFLLALVAVLVAYEWQQTGHLSLLTVVMLGLLALILINIPLMPWLVGPVLIHGNYRMKVDREFEPFDPDAADTSPHVAEPIRETAAALTPLGFTRTAHVWTTNEAPRATAFLSLFENPDARTRAIRITLYAGRGKAVQRQTLLAFTTEWTDGREIATNNTTTLSNAPRSPTRTIVNLPGIRDPAELYRIHAAILDHLGATRDSRVPLDGDPVARQAVYSRREQERFVEAGYLYPDAEGEYYRATWKGAALMAWKLLWPVSAIRRSSLRRRSQALLRACRPEGESNRAG